MWNTSYLSILNWNTKEKVIFFKILLNFGPAQPGPSILNLAQAQPGPKANIGLGPWPGRAKISMAQFRPGPKHFGPNSSLHSFYLNCFYNSDFTIPCLHRQISNIYWCSFPGILLIGLLLSIFFSILSRVFDRKSSNTISSNIERTRLEFIEFTESLIEQTRTSFLRTSIWLLYQTQTPYFWLQINRHQT